MAKSKALDFPISEALRETVKNKPTIKEVHFDSKGNHYFVAYKHKDSNSLYGFIKKFTQKRDGVQFVTEIPDLSTLIVGTLQRDEIVKE